jgi:hypothetical protein
MVLLDKAEKQPNRHRSAHIRLVDFTNSLPVSLGHRALLPANHIASQKLRSQRRPFELRGNGDPRRRAAAYPRRATADFQALSLGTFFGTAKKVSRLPGGSGELKYLILFLIQHRDRRDAPRQAPHFLSKRPQKVRKKGLSPAEGMFRCRGPADSSPLVIPEAAAASLFDSFLRHAYAK